jgi:precorrin-8X/cobalt-precorrin-8 methylmutase
VKEDILLLGHGSPKADANNLDKIADMLHSIIHPGCSEECVGVAYMEFAEPTIKEAILLRVNAGSKKIVLHPFFLNAGIHVTEDIPGIIGELATIYPDVEFVYTEPLGIHEKLVQVALERINAKERLKPMHIEDRSFSVIASESDIDSFPAEQRPVIKRVIHATADYDFLDNLKFHADAIALGIKAIREGKDILTDVEMVRTGINKRVLAKWGGKVVCGLDVVLDAVEYENTNGGAHSTRSEKGIEKMLAENSNIGIIAIGNAPTALLKAIDVLAGNTQALDCNNMNGPTAGSEMQTLECNDTENFSDGSLIKDNSIATPETGRIIIGVPVGFVKAVESKDLLAGSDIPYITALGRKGGTPVAVAIVNAMIKMAGEMDG